LGVVFLGSDVEVVRVDTWWVVAVMQDEHVRRHRPVD
jgi:hypothetical protein